MDRDVVTRAIAESAVEDVSLDWLSGLGSQIVHGPDIAPDMPNTERVSFGDVCLADRLNRVLARVNSDLPTVALQDAFRKVLRISGPTLSERNHLFHRLLADGVDVELHSNGRIVHDKACLIDFDRPENNDFLAVNQFTVIEDRHDRRPDVVLFINGLPLAVVELKDPIDEEATTRKAFNQLQTYKAEISSLFVIVRSKCRAVPRRYLPGPGRENVRNTGAASVGGIVVGTAVRGVKRLPTARCLRRRERVTSEAERVAGVHGSRTHPGTHQCAPTTVLKTAPLTGEAALPRQPQSTRALFWRSSAAPGINASCAYW